VTNPPIDPIREELVMSLETTIGPEQNLFEETPLHCRQLQVKSPTLSNEQLAQVKALDDGHLRAVTLPILTFGTDEQRSRFVPPLARGEVLGAFALTEPEAGSDAGSLRTSATPDGDGWVISGAKQWITNGHHAGTFLLFYQTSLGLVARAVIANRPMAGSLGLNTRRMDRMTFAFGAALAGLAGAVMAPLMSVDPQMGVGFLIPAFLSILVGGTGTLLGTLLGTTLIAGAGTVVSSIWTQITAQIVVFALAIVVIRLFPQGLAGGSQAR